MKEVDKICLDLAIHNSMVLGIFVLDHNILSKLTKNGIHFEPYEFKEHSLHILSILGML